ncbi:hypothetical protein H5410_033055 [Solanum commersonii]|uniref:Ubiquitin-like protease family profile domain-containing protein n=1 Tax=Solanum commersonii TaxID=4109 RepID=A0A9J5YP11_SOLCO|nr:hypothetical protein H5410_033055 [Solanum commersonii]
MTYNIDVHTSKKVSQPLKCWRLKKSIFQSLFIISERKKSITTAPVSHSNPKGKEKGKEEEEQGKAKERVKEKAKEKEKEKEQEKEKEKVKKKAKEKVKKKAKKVEVVSCDVKQQYPFEGFNIDGEGPIAFPKNKDWFYIMSQPNKCWTDEYVDVILYYLQKKLKQQSHSKYLYTTTNCFFKTYIDNASVVPEYKNKIVGTIKGFGIPTGLPWHLTDEVYVLINCNRDFHWVLAIVVLKERHIKVYDSMSSSRTNRKLCAQIQKLSTMLPKYLESSRFLSKKTKPTGQFLNLTGARTNLTHSKSYMLLVLPNKQAIVFFVAAYAEFLSDGLQIPSDEIISQCFRLRYDSLLWNYGILQARSGYVSNNENPQRPRPKKVKFIDENVVIKVLVAIFSTTAVVICCDSLLQQGVVALIISSLSLISSQDGSIVIPFEILSDFKKLNLKKNENSTTTLLEELASEKVSSSQVEAEFSQKEYEEREKEKIEVDDDGERAEEAEQEEGNKKEVEEDNGKQKEVEEEEGKNKEVVEQEEEKINEVDEDIGKQKEVDEEEQEKNVVEDAGIKIINAHTFPVHLQPNATGDSIMRSAMGKRSNTFRITLKQNGLKDFFRNSCFDHFLDLPENNNTRFQMTMVYELLKRRFIFQNSEKNDEDTPRKHKESLCLLWFVHNVLLAKDLNNNNISLKWVNLSQDIEAFNNYPWGHESFELTVKYLLKPLGPKTNNLFGFPSDFMENKNAWAFEVIPHLTHQVNAKKEISSPRILGWPLTINVATDDSYVATYDPSIAIYNTNVATDDSYVATDDPSIATCDTSFAPMACPNRKGIENDISNYSRYVNEILSLMRERHVRYPEYYDSTNRILDLNLYSNFKLRYDKKSEEATTDEDMINYVRGIRQYPRGMNWIGAKRLLAIMNLNKTHFVTLEILLQEGHMNVYDCLLMVRRMQWVWTAGIVSRSLEP